MSADPATAASAGAAIEFQHVGKQYWQAGKALPVLADFNLEIRHGEFIAIVGTSGCGKSTLLRLLAGLDPDYQGTIQIDAVPVRGVPPACSLVFQEPRLFPWLTVAANIELGLLAGAGRTGQRRERVQQQIRLVGLQGFERSLPHQLSGGMAQRVAIARGLAPEPQILLLDEPFGALDALTRRQMQTELATLAGARPITTLLVTHDVDEAVLLADRVVVLSSRPGRIKSVLKVPLAQPRQRSSPEFQALAEQITSHLLSAPAVLR